MAEIEFRQMTTHDKEFYKRLMDMVGWGLTVDDLERMLHYEPEGCFVARLRERDVGMVASYSYGGFGWIGNLITILEVRGLGVGAALMRKAMGRLIEGGVTSIRLDAVAKAIPLYKRLGFKPEYQSLRFRGVGRLKPMKSVSQLREGDLKEVEVLDGRFFGANRGKIHSRILHDFPDLCFSTTKGGRMIGYIMAKRGTGVCRVGPWICEPEYPEAASSLLDAIMNMVKSESIWVGVPERNEASIAILRARGFEPLPSSLRMCFGECREVEYVRGIFGIGAAEKG